MADAKIRMGCLHMHHSNIGYIDAIVHFTVAGLFIYFWIACCCVAAYELTGRFWAAFAVHAINNGVVFVLSVHAARG